MQVHTFIFAVYLRDDVVAVNYPLSELVSMFFFFFRYDMYKYNAFLL